MPARRSVRTLFAPPAPPAPPARPARRRATVVIAATAAVASGVWLAAPAALAAPGDGSAFGIQVNVTLLGGGPITVGPLASSSTAGPGTSTLASATIPGVLTTGVVTSSASEDSTTGDVTSTASTANVGLPLLAALGAVSAQSIAVTCNATQSGEAGTVTLTNASLGALGALASNPVKNTVIQINIAGIHVATLTLNEQIPNADGSLTVNAFHLHLIGGAVGALGTGDVVISSATCGPAVVSSPPASTTTTSQLSASTVNVGTGVTDTATVSTGTGSPGGTMSFTQCGPLTTASGCPSTATALGSAQTLSPSGGSASATSAALTPSTPGIYCIGAFYSGDSTHAASSDTTACFTATGTQTITFTPDLTGVYGDSQTLSATGGASGQPVVFSVDATSQAGVCQLGADGVTLTYTGVGNCVVDANQAGDGSYSAAAQVQATIVVSPRPLTVTASSTTQLFGSPAPVITPSYSGLLPGDDINVVAPGITCTSAVTPTTPRGSYPSSCSGGVSTLYAISYVNGTVQVTAPTGVGVANVFPHAIQVGLTGQTVSIVYLAPAAGLLNGALSVTVPAGWPAPSTTKTDQGYVKASCGTVTVSGMTIKVTGVTMAGGRECDITYGSRASGGPGLTVPTTAGQAVFTVAERSTAAGSLKALPHMPGIFLTAHPVITGLSLTTAPVAGGTPLTITGYGFVPGSTVLIGQGSGLTGALACGNVAVTSATQITCTLPASAVKGTVSVYVVSPTNQVSPNNSSNTFRYV